MSDFRHFLSAVKATQRWGDFWYMRDNRGNLPIENACMNGHLEFCKKFFQSCEKYPKIATGKKDLMSRCLRLACRSGHLQLCKFLVINGVGRRKISTNAYRLLCLPTGPPLVKWARELRACDPNSLFKFSRVFLMGTLDNPRTRQGSPHLWKLNGTGGLLKRLVRDFLGVTACSAFHVQEADRLALAADGVHLSVRKIQSLIRQYIAWREAVVRAKCTFDKVMLDSGRLYYWNSVTRKSQWQKPRILGRHEDCPLAAASVAARLSPPESTLWPPSPEPYTKPIVVLRNPYVRNFDVNFLDELYEDGNGNEYDENDEEDNDEEQGEDEEDEEEDDHDHYDDHYDDDGHSIEAIGLQILNARHNRRELWAPRYP